MATFFHVSTVYHSAGQVLQPGSWGNSARQFGAGPMLLSKVEDAKTLAWESNLETARRILKPDAPSRLGCIFGCASLVHALAFRDKYRAGAPIFEVAAADDVANYVGDFDLISSQPTGIALVDALVVGCNQILERAAIRHSGSSYRRPGHNRKEALRSGVITALAT